MFYILNDLNTNIHIKPTNIHQYVEYSSCHPKTCLNGIPFSQAKRYRRICSDVTDFNDSIVNLRKYFIDRNYPASVIDSAFDNVKNMSQSEALEPSVIAKDKNIVPFVIEYNPSLPNIGGIVNKYWDLLKLSNSPAVRALHDSNPILALKRPKNIKDTLIKTKLPTFCNNKFNSSKCSRTRCSHCSNIVESDHFTSSQTNSEFKLNFDSNCTSSNVIYLITCKRCSMQYVGQTSQQVSKRMNSHRFDINSFINPAFTTHIAAHFNRDNHKLQDFSFMPIDKVDNNMERLLKETYWIHKLDTVFPKGLNSKILYPVY